jgi:hypothetical protein
MARVGTLKWANARGGRLRLPEKLELLAQCCLLSVEEVGGRLRARLDRGSRHDHHQSQQRIWVEVESPATRLSQAAADLCCAVSEPWLQAHCFRTYEIGRELARGCSFDPEVLFVAAMLHDVGLTDAYRRGSDPGLVPGYAGMDEPCFAVRGALVARRLAALHGWSAASSDVLGEAICLHLNVRVPHSTGVEASLLNAASALDAIRLGSYKLGRNWVRTLESRSARGDAFCTGLRKAWARESEHTDCRAALLNTAGAFDRLIRRTCGASWPQRR